MTTSLPQPGLLLFAHGARDPRWAEPFAAIARRIAARRPGLAVALGYLELMQPDMAGAAAALVQAGCRRIDVLPLFLGTGGHVRRDLPQALDALRHAHPDIRFTLHGAIGEVDAVLDAMAEAALATVAAGAIEDGTATGRPVAALPAATEPLPPAAATSPAKPAE